MPNVRVAKVSVESVDDPVWLDDTYFHDMTSTSITIRVTDREFFKEQDCLVTLFCAEESNGLKYVM
jgi:hypothetical protein